MIITWTFLLLLGCVLFDSQRAAPTTTVDPYPGIVVTHLSVEHGGQLLLSCQYGPGPFDTSTISSVRFFKTSGNFTDYTLYVCEVELVGGGWDTKIHPTVVDHVDAINVTTLLFNNTMYSDGGSYKCEVHHAGPARNSYFKVVVYNHNPGTTTTSGINTDGTTAFVETDHQYATSVDKKAMRHLKEHINNVEVTDKYTIVETRHEDTDDALIPSLNYKDWPVWVDRFINLITGKMPSSNLQNTAVLVKEIHADGPHDLDDCENAGDYFLREAGTGKAYTFLTNFSLHKDEEVANIAAYIRMLVYDILRQMTQTADAESEVKRKLLDEGICQQATDDIKNITAAFPNRTAESWQLVEVCLLILRNCAGYSDISMKTRLKEICMEMTLDLTLQKDAGLLYWCVPTINYLDGLGELSIDADVVKTWAGWLTESSYDDTDKRYKFKLPEPSMRGSTVGSLFRLFKYTSQLKTPGSACVLLKAIQPHRTVIQQAIIKGIPWDKIQITTVLQDLAAHRCYNRCDKQWVRSVLKDNV